ncbi:MAG: hypothetical protein Fur0010_03610 [Bdellovibrio sp.]
MKKLLIFLIALQIESLFAQSSQKGNDDFFKALREQMKAEREQMEKYFQGDFFDRVDQMIEQMQKDFFNQYDQMLKDDQWGDLFKQMELGVGEVPSRWEPTKDGQKLIVEVTPMKDAPLEINIHDHLVTLKGTVEKTEKRDGAKGKVLSRRIFTFHQNIAVPPNLDPQSAIVEQSKDSITITFKEKSGKGKNQKIAPSKSKDLSQKYDKKNQEPELEPLKPADGDIDL